MSASSKRYFELALDVAVVDVDQRSRAALTMPSIAITISMRLRQ
jgi:hypothetical protein